MGGGGSKSKKGANDEEQWLQRRDLPPGNPFWTQPHPAPQLKGIHPVSKLGARKPRRLAPSQSLVAGHGASALRTPLLPHGQKPVSGVMPNPGEDELVVMASAAGQDPVSVLNKLKDLLDSGMIDKADYDKRKHKLLDRMMEDGSHISTNPA
eukprot:SAG31_NODE_20554_length_571_cov_0.877119_1_plen_151_part_10